MSSYWLFTITEDNWYIVKEHNIIGVPERSVSRVKERVKPGDYIIFYVTKRNSKSLGGKIVGVYRVVSEWFQDTKPLWLDEYKENRVKYPLRARLEPVKLGVVEFSELVDKLGFIKRRDKYVAHLIGTPANGGKPIPERDAQVIIEALR